MKLLYYLPAIGNNNLDIKYNILLHNLNYIYNNIGEKFSIAINFYTVSEMIKENIKNLDFIENMYVYEKEGILTELFLDSDSNKYLSSYDYILFVLDDVKIIDLDILKMIEIKNKYNIEILSPKITKSTHKFMNEYSNNKLTFNNFLEIYLLLLSPTDFNKFCSIHTKENKWMWGVDFLFGYYKITTAVIHKYSANHELPSNGNSGEAITLCDQYLKSKTKFTNLSSIQRVYKPVINTIDLVN
jgi:hypothetical protein